MDETIGQLRKFNRTNLVNEINRILPIPRSNLNKAIKDYIWPRLDFLHGKSRRANQYFLFEENYVETEWKDMISVHYINTSYEVSNTVMRIHIFSRPEIVQESYLGCFTLRKIDEVKIMLSYIYPNWSKVYYRNEKLCVMTYRKKVHIVGREFVYNTYPLFVQDNITVACAQANVISMTQYLHQKFDYRKARILDLNKAISGGKEKPFPTLGLNPAQMIEIFNYYNIPVGASFFFESDEISHENCCEGFREYIDYTVESGIPVLLGITIKDAIGIAQRHVVQIIGHTKQDRESYIIYDDSGYFLKNVFKGEGFVGCVTWEKLQTYIESEKSFIIYPIHEKVYLLYDDMKKTFSHMYEYLCDSETISVKESESMRETRFLLADNRDLKEFFRENILSDSETDDVIRKEVERILLEGMPHFVWCCETPIKDGYFIFIADPTYGRITTRNIFLNRVPIYTKKQIGLLKYT